MASVSVQGWFVLVDGNGLLDFPHNVTVFPKYIHMMISQGVLVVCGGHVFCDGRVGMFVAGVFFESHHSFNTLRSLLVSPKDKTQKEKKCGGVH